MSDLRKAAEQVSEAWDWDWSEPRNKALKERIDALRQAVAQPEQEPVGYVTIENISSWAQVPSIKWFKKPTEGPLYTAPPKREWIGLTRRELDIATLGLEDLSDCYKAIESKLKEKNGG
jgi:hypothetical protein